MAVKKEEGSGEDTTVGADTTAGSGGDTTSGDATLAGAGEDSLAGGSGAGGTSGDDAIAEAPAKKQDWREARIAVLTAKLREAEAKKAAVVADPAVVEDKITLTQAELDARIAEGAKANSTKSVFNQRCEEAATEGRKQYKDFNTSVSNLVGNLVDKGDPQSVRAYDEFVAAALETGEAPRLIYELGKDLDEAQRILSLPSTARTVELTKMALKDPGVSGAPRPIKPIGQRQSSTVSIDPADPERADNLTTAEWMKRREAQVNPRKSA